MQDTFNLLLLLEVVLPFFILTLVLTFILFRRKAQDKKALQRLITQFKEKEEDRRESTIEFLKNKAGLEDPAREEASKKLLKARKSFLQKIITTFLTRKAEAIANLDNELSVITSAYQELSIVLPQDEVSNQKEEDAPPAAKSEIKVEGDPELEKELKRLRNENKSLETEIETTLSTLNSIFAEYTSMFGEETKSKDMSVEDILSAMESYGQDNVNAASDTDSLKEEPEAKPDEPETEEEPSWDEAFAETAEPDAKTNTQDQSTDKEDNNKTDDGWGDDAAEDSEYDLDNEDLEDIQPEWGNAVEDELIDPKDDKN
ncbi:MAG: hypothetical protein GY808_08065 [Gammaproteobacteria bacterium]|nr:hypothetical protein [Gammaproteobacteria bacterium]